MQMPVGQGSGQRPQGSDQGQGRAAPPAPESPLWLPALAQPAAEAGRLTGAAAAGTLPRAKDLRALRSSAAGDPRRLFDSKTLLQQHLPLPAGRGRPAAGAAAAAPPPRHGALQQQQHTTHTLPILPTIASPGQARAAGRGGAPPAAPRHGFPGTGGGSGGPAGGDSAGRDPGLPASPRGDQQQQQQQQNPDAAFDPQLQQQEQQEQQAPRAAPPASPRAAAPGARTAVRAASPAAPDPDRVPGVETGTDAVAFFGRHGQDSPVKFFYCVRAPEGPRFRPYDLVVVGREEVRGEYFTVSSTGIVRIRKGAQAEFTPLADWVREAAMFDAVASIGFFRNYLTGRTFRAWVKVVRRKHFQRVRAAVARRLLAAKANFWPALSEIQGHVDDLRVVSFCSSNAAHLHTLQEYSELQQAAREGRAQPAIEAAVERVQRVLERVCRDVQAQAALYQESVRDEAELADTTGVELGQGRAGAGRVRPMVVVKKEKMERAANYARIMEELSLLGPLVRLADYLVVGGVMGRALAAAEYTLAMLNAGRGAGAATNKGVFTAVVSFGPGGATTFAPDAPAVMDEINGNTIEGALSLAQARAGPPFLGCLLLCSCFAAPRVLFMRAFGYLFDARPSGLNPLATLRASPEFVAARQAINAAVAGDFTALRDAARVLEEYRRVWEFGRTWDGDAYAAQPRSLAEIRRDLVVQRSWKGLLERMKTSLVVGCLQVDAKPLKAELIPITQAAQERIKLVLLALAREATLAALDDLQGRLALLGARPPGLDGYMGYLAMHLQQVEDRRQLVATCGAIDDMYDSLAAHEQKARAPWGRVPTAEQVKHDDLTAALAAFQQQLAEGKEWLADAKPDQVAALQSAVADANRQLEEVAGSLHSGMYVDAEADPEEVVADLEAGLQRLGGLGDALATYNQAGGARRPEGPFWDARYLGLVDQPQDEGAALMLAEKELNARYQLWLSLRDFAASSAGWTEEAVLDDDGALLLEIEAIRAEVEEYASKAYKSSKTLKDDPVAGRLKEVVDDFKEIMLLVEELANPALKARHWEEVFALIGAEIEPNEGGTGFAPFSIRYLLQFDLLDKLERLQAIGAQASKEMSLEKALARMKADWAGLAFRVVVYKESGTFVIGGTDDVQALLDDHIVKAQTMRSSPFLKPLEAEAVAWEALLLRTQDLLDNWLACQSTWQYLEPIFSSPDILAQMPEEGDMFQQASRACGMPEEGDMF
ncbi:MAG: dynein heavy chain, N-terminal region 2-domain-containing protein [Monoraphidium minutum]|nr:MAG: dynein heavy chain, N-terminal region 2-domain-containing protein [Monoraphidium minutum]